MKKSISFVLIIVVVLVLVAAKPIKGMTVNKTDTVVSSVFEVADEVAEISNNVIKARFENMLNNNFVYNTDFQSQKIIIENSILALLDKGVDGEINQSLVLGFIADMYGLQVNPEVAEYDFAPASEGMFVILPRGYTKYHHTVTDILEEEGGFTVLSDVLIMTHDGEQYNSTAKTVFVPNIGSSFAYNIISSDIL